MSFVLMVVLKSTIILICAALIALALRRGSASARHAIWASAIVSALVLPFASTLLPPLDLPVLPFFRSDSLPLRVVPERIDSSLEGSAVAAYTEALMISEPSVDSGNVSSPGVELLALTWFVGALFIFVRFILASLTVRRLIQRSVEAEDSSWRELIEQLRGRLSITRPIRLFFHEAALSPMTWGRFRHVILLSSNAKQWTPARRRLVLTHELAHVKRNDGLMQLGIQLACSVYWFNPMVWYAGYRLRLEREHACDDQVLNQGTNPEDYAQHLIEIARGLCHDATFSFAAISMAQPSQLETRVRSIINSRISRRTLSRPAMTSLLASIALLTASIAAVGIAAEVPLPSVLSANPMPVPESVRENPAATTTPKAARSQRTRIGDAGTAPTAGVTPPRVMSSEQPPYTREAFAKRIEGTVTLEAAVDRQGNVTVLRTVKGLGLGLDENAARALGQWKFAPAQQNGVAVDSITQIDVDFILANDRSMNATMSGTVSSTGTINRMPGVVMTATNVATGVVATVLTDNAGTYQFASISPATYKLTAELPGYKPQSFTGIVLAATQQVRLNFALERLIDVSFQLDVSPTEAGPGTTEPFRVGGDVTAPTVIHRVEPQYSAQARAERHQGTVVLEAVVRADGSVDVVRVVRSLGLGLDENAIDALKQWKFRPAMAMKDDKPVPVRLNIEVNFNLK